MDLDGFCEEIKKNYPEISEKADKLYDDYWNGLVKMEFSSYSWFESLANAINGEMKKKTPISNYVSIFKAISSEYENGQYETKNAIDVAFVENLFWRVKGNEASPYWKIMPKNLKDLYVGFHGRTPL